MTYMKGEVGNSAWGIFVTLPSYKEKGEVEIEFMFNLETDEFEIIGIWMDFTNFEGESIPVDISIFPSPRMEALDILNARKKDIIKYEQVRT